MHHGPPTYGVHQEDWPVAPQKLAGMLAMHTAWVSTLANAQLPLREGPTAIPPLVPQGARPEPADIIALPCDESTVLVLNSSLPPTRSKQKASKRQNNRKLHRCIV
mmetsp:Transcript_144684/g.463597  ORF Transcript_144684/g.463597 Transcript_144684/m.463597 type:complete len:106 (+) Transcript_144684:305-622(+)